MWIFLIILFFIAILITAALMLPVYIIVRNDENNKLILRYKILFKTFGQESNPDNPIALLFKKSSGISQIQTQKIKTSIKKSGLFSTLSSTYNILISLLREIVKLLKHCTVEKLCLDIVCTGADAAEAAINYGKCSSLTYPFLGMVDVLMKIKRNKESVNISCDPLCSAQRFDYNIVISVRIFRLLAAFIRIAFKEARRLFISA